MTKAPDDPGQGRKERECQPALCPLLRSVAKLIQKTDRPNRNRNDADSDAETSTGDDPAHASTDYPERNYVCQYRVAHGVASVPASRLQEFEN